MVVGFSCVLCRRAKKLYENNKKINIYIPPFILKIRGEKRIFSAQECSYNPRQALSGLSANTGPQPLRVAQVRDSELDDEPWEHQVSTAISSRISTTWHARWFLTSHCSVGCPVPPIVEKSPNKPGLQIPDSVNRTWLSRMHQCRTRILWWRSDPVSGKCWD